MAQRRLTNREVAQVFLDIADMMEVKGEQIYRVLAYRRAGDNILRHPHDLAGAWERGELKAIPGIGDAIAQKIDELFQTGRLEFHERLRREVPDGVVAILRIPNVGPRTAKLLFESLGLASVADVAEAAREHRLRDLPGLGAKKEENILRGIEMLERVSGIILLGDALPVAEELVSYLARWPAARSPTPAGSLRRLKPIVGDIDLLAASSNPKEVVDWFVRYPGVETVSAHGDNKGSVILGNGLQVDLLVLAPERFGSLLQHFTGSKEHNVHLREIARKRSLSLSEHGFQRDEGGEIVCATEEEVYRALEMPWIPPELREDRGEIEAALSGLLPRLVEQVEVRGDLQSHTTHSDGRQSIRDMALRARELGYAYLAVTDHSHGLGMVRGVGPDDVPEIRHEVEALNEELAPFRVLHGVECEVRADGDLDLPEEVLAGFDIVLVSTHSAQRQERARITERIVRAIHSPHVDVLAHPFGRLLGQRDPIDMDFEAVLKACAETNTMLEINASPQRLDLDDEHARAAVQAGVRLTLGTDAHNVRDLEWMRFGVAVARRAWAGPQHVANTLELEELLALLDRD